VVNVDTDVGEALRRSETILINWGKCNNLPQFFVSLQHGRDNRQIITTQGIDSAYQGNPNGVGTIGSIKHCIIILLYRLTYTILYRWSISTVIGFLLYIKLCIQVL
jgi:hypothetical protein